MTSAVSASSGWRDAPANALAGCLTAAVFYAEYTGLGAGLGAVLPGSGGAATGSVMVVGAVVLSCLVGLLSSRPLLAGPRAASLAVLIFGMRLATGNSLDASANTAIAMAALALMLLVAAATQLLGTIGAVQDWIYRSHVALRKGFIFATAIGIVVSLGLVQLDGCLRVSPGWTALVVATSFGSALAWTYWCSPPPGQPPAERTFKAKLAPLAMVIGVALATAGYYALVQPYAQGDYCATLGRIGLQPALLSQLLLSPAAVQSAVLALPLWIWPVLLLLGFLLGLVLLLESLTTLRDSKDQTAATLWSGQIRMRALTGLLSAPLGLACASLSGSRTNALLEAHGSTRVAVFFHGLGLLAILFFMSAWIAKVPQLAVAVALLLVATQMIDDETRSSVWRAGYNPQAPASNIHTAWMFWAMLVMSVGAGCLLRYMGWGFGGGPLIALLLGAVWLAVTQGRGESALSVDFQAK